MSDLFPKPILKLPFNLLIYTFNKVLLKSYKFIILEFLNIFNTKLSLLVIKLLMYTLSY